MEADPLERGFVQVEEVQEDERLQHLTEVAGAHQARDGAVATPSRAMDDRPRVRWGRGRCQPIDAGHREARPANCERRANAIRAVKARRTTAAVGALWSTVRWATTAPAMTQARSKAPKRGLAGDHEEERAHDLERSGEVAEPLAHAESGEEGDHVWTPQELSGPGGQECECDQHLERPQHDVEGGARSGGGLGVTGCASVGRHAGNLGLPAPWVLTLRAGY